MELAQMHRFKSRSTKNVIGIQLSGRLTRQEYRQIVPILEEKIATYGKIRLLVELDHWEGWGPYAALNDIVFVFKNSMKLERVAFVVHSKDDTNAVLIDRPFSPWSRENTRYFSFKEKNTAWRWVGEGIEGFNMPQEDDALPLKPEIKMRYGPQLKTLIIGAGVSGLTLATLLQKRGFKPEIAEVGEFSSTTPRTLTLWPSATGVFKSLGFYKKIKKYTTQLHAFSVFDTQGEPLQIFDNTPLENVFGNTYSIPHEQLVFLLTDSLDQDYFRYETSVEDIKELNYGVEVTFSDGTKEHYDCVICSDGFHSKFREQLFNGCETNYTGWCGWSFSVDPNFELPTDTFAYKSENSYIQFIACDQRLYVLASVKCEKIPSESIDHAKFLKEAFKDFPKFAKNVVSYLVKDDPIHFQPFYELTQPTRIRDRVALVGQAAFVYPLTTFFGDTSTIESAYILADELSRADTKTLPAALKRYEQRLQARFLNTHCSPPDLLHTKIKTFEQFWQQYLEIPF